VDSQEVRRQWAERSGEYSPEYYAYYGPDETSESLLELIGRYVGREASVLELGCSAGRHLAHLHDHGYGDLTGIEINEDALGVMADAYPELASDGSFHFAAIEDVVGEFPDDSFDVVYSVQTLQHIHPDDAWIFPELARITDDLLITVETERYRGDDGASGGDDGGEDSADGDDSGRGDGDDRHSGGNGDGGGDGGDADDSGDENDGDDVAEAGGGTDLRGVNYVNDEFPLYYRDWNRVFTDLGLVEVDAWTGERNTTRAFRTPEK
jgi:SAM-dependent methyltransferase